MSGRGRRPLRPAPAAWNPETEPDTGSTGLAPEPPYRPPSVRALVGLLLLAILLGGVAYPAAVTGFAEAVTPQTAGGSLLYSANGTVIGSELIGQNITNTSLFWLRPSLQDYSATLGSGEDPYGPTDPNLLNLTRHYLAADGLNASTTVPLVLVAPSESGLDPALTPDAVLVQIPRVAHFTHLSSAFLLSFVQAHIQAPIAGFIGPAYVNVITLDVDLLQVLGG